MVHAEADAFQRRFDEALAGLIAPQPPARFIVAFSGGLDSTLLLDFMRQSGTAVPIMALHVDHGLHDDSADWAAHCAAHADALGIPFLARRVNLDRGTGQSLEAVAREARYAVFEELLERCDVLLTAHHADDQLETVLLRLLRGTGIRGLAAIRAQAPLGAGQLARPLLDFTRAEILAEAERRGLDWLEDPSNADPRFDRNYLRQRCLPPLFERWPRAGVLANRLARQMVEAEAALAELATADLAGVEDPECVPLSVFAGLSEARLHNALRYAILAAGLPVPNAAQSAELCRMLEARHDAEAVVCWPGAEARLYRQQLYLLPPLASATPSESRISPGRVLHVQQGKLSLVASADYGIPDQWASDGLIVAFREGGERFHPRGSACRKSLKHWFQETGIVPWMRNTVPLLYRGDQLVAVGDLALVDGLPQADADAPFWRPVWTGHARLR